MEIDQLKKVFRKTLKIDGYIDYTNLTVKNMSQWNSLMTMLLVSEIEQVFGIRFSINDIMTFNSFESAKQIISNHLEKI